MTLAVLLSVALFGCTGSTPQNDNTGPRVSRAEAGNAIELAAPGVTYAELELPQDSRQGVDVPETLALFDSPKVRRNARVDAPVVSRNLFFHRPPVGMELRDGDGRRIPAGSRSAPAPKWTWNGDEIALTGGKRDFVGPITFSYPLGSSRERRLNFGMSGISDPAAFVRYQMYQDHASTAGLLLPAPSTIAVRMDIPPAADLTFEAGILRPELNDGSPSDGAEVIVEIELRDGSTQTLWKGPVEVGKFTAQSVPLDAHAGQKKALIRIRTEPGATADRDYVVLRTPAVASRLSDPRTVVMVFVDTLRPDHMGVYGYNRDTTPAMSAKGKEAAVFENARSIAPWTLPSARTLLTGRQPELFDLTPTLPERLRDEGFASAMFAGNLYLGANFNIDRGWGLHRNVLWPSAEDQVDHAISWLSQHNHRDALMLVHFMDVHLPYQEPEPYLSMWAGERPETLKKDEFHLNEVRRARLRTPEDRQYVRDRYDQSIRYVDAQLERLFTALPDDAIVMVMSDHGEEFWDHRGFEHGHTLYDELLRVPLMVWGPGIPAGRHSEPVSLLDVTPTLLDALGIDTENPLDGTSLLPLSRGEEGASDSLSRRAQVFGRPLYGADRWGALTDQHKYMTSAGEEQAFDLSEDPAENVNVFRGDPADLGAPYREQIQGVLGRSFQPTFRLANATARAVPEHDLVASVTVPGGIKTAFVGMDPTNASMAYVRAEGDELTVVWPQGFRGQREVYFLPCAGLSAAADMAVTLSLNGETSALGFNAREYPNAWDRPSLGTGSVAGRTVALSYGIAPEPGEGSDVVGFDAESALGLEALGYMVAQDPAATSDRDGFGPTAHGTCGSADGDQ